MQLENHLCVCIPTKNRPEMVEDVLSHALAMYRRYDLTVIYVDSSTDSRTESIINRFRHSGFPGLYCRREDPDISLDQKTFRIFSQGEELRRFDYFWYLNDSIALRDEALSRVFSLMGENYDLIRFPLEGSGQREDCVLSDIDEWFRRTSEGISHMGSTIMRRSLLSPEPDWKTLYEKYIVTEKAGTPQHEYFFTIGFYYEQLARMASFRGIMLGNGLKWRWNSPIKKGRSYWMEWLFEVWARSYPSTFFKLPACYTGKEQVIRNSDNISRGRFERQSLLAYRRQGILTVETARRYERFWNLVSTLSFEEILTIAAAPIVPKQDGEDRCAPDAWEQGLNRIEPQLDGRGILLYGAGVTGEYVLNKLVADGYGAQVMGFAVTEPGKNVDSVEGLPVRGIRDCLDKRDSAAVIIAALPDSSSEIHETLCCLGFKHIFSVFG